MSLKYIAGMTEEKNPVTFRLFNTFVLAKAIIMIQHRRESRFYSSCLTRALNKVLSRYVFGITL